MNAAEPRGADTPTEKIHFFGAGPWRGEIPCDGLKGSDVAARFLTRLAPHHFLRTFPRLDNARNTLKKPGLWPLSRPGANAKLFNQDHLVAYRGEGQDGGHFAALHYFS